MIIILLSLLLTSCNRSMHGPSFPAHVVTKLGSATVIIRYSDDQPKDVK